MKWFKASNKPVSPAAQKVIEAVRAEMAIPEGRQKLLDALKLAKEASRRFREASRVDPESLRDVYGASHV